MASIFQSSQDLTANREAFKKEKSEEREDLGRRCDEGIIQVSGDPDRLADFLKVMVAVPGYTSRNAMLVFLKDKDVSHVENPKAWYDMGRYVKDEEKDNGIKIMVGKDKGRGTVYDVRMVYDVSQTYGKAVKKPGVVLEEGTPEMQQAFDALVEFSPVPIIPDAELTMPARYDPAERVIRVSDSFTDYETFAAMVNANTHARIHKEDIAANRGADMGYNTADSEFLTSCVTYVVCQRFGVPVPGMDFETPAAVLGSMDKEGMDAMLKILGDNAKECGNRVQNRVKPPAVERVARAAGSAR